MAASAGGEPAAGVDAEPARGVLAAQQEPARLGGRGRLVVHAVRIVHGFRSDIIPSEEPFPCYSSALIRERQAEADGRDHADELAAVLERLRHHRVREHRQDRARGKREDERNRGRSGASKTLKPNSADRPETRATRTHSPRIRLFVQPARASPVVGRERLGRLEMKTAARKAALTRRRRRWSGRARSTRGSRPG